MPITDVSENPWASASLVPSPGSPSANVTDIEGNPWQTPSVGADVAKSFGSRAIEAGRNIIGLTPALIGAGATGLMKLNEIAGNPLSAISPGGTGLEQAAANKAAIAQAMGTPSYQYKAQTVPGEIAGALGDFAPGLVAGSGSLLNRAVTQVAVPAAGAEAGGQLFKGTEAEPYARALGGIAGGLAGGAVPALARKAVTPFPLSAERQASLNTLQSEGVQVPASMATGSKALKAAESQLGGETYRANVERMNDQFTQATLRKAGINADRATPDVINTARDQIGSVFDTVAANNRKIPVPGFHNAAQAIAGDYQRITGAESPALKDIFSKVGPWIDGDSYQAIQSQIGRDARATSSPELRSALYDTKSALDAAVQNNLKNPADAQAWKGARQQWANLLTIEKAVSGSTETAAMGQITPAKLTQAIDSMKRGNYVRGRGDFADLARAGNVIMKPLQDSGTASRLGPIAKLAALGGGFAAGGIPGLASAGAGVAAPWLAGKALMTPLVQRYLTNQSLGSGPTAGSRVLGAGLPSLLAILNANQQLQ
jgi:hypothetical protein